MKPKALVILFAPLLVFVAVFALFVFASTSTYMTWKVSDETAPAEAVSEAMRRVGPERADWKTLVLSVSKEVDVPRSAVWATWSKLESWPEWSVPLHASTQWVRDSGWRAGTEFVQVLNLGFPVGEQTSRERVGRSVEGEQVTWWKEENGIRSCHIWKFEDIPGGKTRITNTEVFRGTSIGIVKMLVGVKWLKLFELAVDGLARKAAHQSP